MDRRTKSIAGAALALLAWGGPAAAFHDGGVAYCEGCHTMHNSGGGAAKTVNPLPSGSANAYLLQGSDPSSTCLKCHGGTRDYHVATLPVPQSGPPENLTPGGDFAYLRKTYSWTTSWGAAQASPGERHGHNVVATDFQFAPDATLAAAPGGTYPSATFSCVSCHDPHGRYRVTDNLGSVKTSRAGVAVPPIRASGSYGETPNATTAVGTFRLLGGKGYQPKSLAGDFAFTYDAMIAVAPTDYNRSEAASDVRVAYGRRSADWCANCHELFHSYYGGGFVHRAGEQLNTDIAANYNAYVKSGDLGGSRPTAYTSLVPFQLDNTADLPTLTAATTSTAGPVANDRVTCLSCHRAHASAWNSMARWNNDAEFLTVEGEYPGTDAPSAEGRYGQYATGKTVAEYRKAMYDRPATAFATFQRSLCNKCHSKD